MIRGIRLIVRDKTAFREEGGVLRQAGKPMDILHNIPEGVKILHIVDLNAKDGNATNLDLYDKMTYAVNIEVEVAPKEEMLKKLFALKARAVLDLPCRLDLEKLGKNKRLLVGKTDGKEKNEEVHDYYIETDDLKSVKTLVADGKRVFLYSRKIDDNDAETAGVFALIRDY